MNTACYCVIGLIVMYMRPGNSVDDDNDDADHDGSVTV